MNILDYEARVRVQSNALGGGGEAEIRFDTCATQVCALKPSELPPPHFVEHF